MVVDITKFNAALERRDKLDFEGTRACVNCSHCRVYGDPDFPMAFCDMYHGTPMPLVDMYRNTNRPLGFRQAYTCPDRDFMDDEYRRRPRSMDDGYKSRANQRKESA